MLSPCHHNNQQICHKIQLPFLFVLISEFSKFFLSMLVAVNERTNICIMLLPVLVHFVFVGYLYILGLHTTNLPQREVDWYSRTRQEKINITKPEEQRIKKEWRTKRALNPYRKKSRTSPAASSWKNTLYKTGHKEWHKVQQQQKETGVE